MIPSFGGYTARTRLRERRNDRQGAASRLSNTAGIDRRNQAIREVEAWATHTHHRLAIAYPLPSTPQGLGGTGIALMGSAAKFRAHVAQTAAAGVVTQLKQTIASHTGAARLRCMVGIIQMNGIDDYGPTETFSAGEAAPFVKWASSKHVNEISFWALERDNGGCVSTKGANDCSGVAQADWAFSQAFAHFTRRR